MLGRTGSRECVKSPLERDVSVLAGWILIALVAEHIERVNQPRAGYARVDHVVHVSAGSRDVGMRELLPPRCVRP